MDAAIDVAALGCLAAAGFTVHPGAGLLALALGLLRISWMRGRS